MASLTISQPLPSEYGGGFTRYITQVEGELFSLLDRQMEQTQALLAGISEERSLHRYAEGKWSIREVAGHMIDCERVFAYRALRFARRDTTELPPFDENLFGDSAAYHRIPLADIAAEYALVRRANVMLFRQFTQDDWDRAGVAGGVRMTVRALAWTCAGHEAHHVRILRERYLA